MSENKSKPDDTLGLCWCQGCLNAATHWGTTPNGERVARCDECDPHWYLDEPQTHGGNAMSENKKTLGEFYTAAFQVAVCGHDFATSNEIAATELAAEAIRRYHADLPPGDEGLWEAVYEAGRQVFLADGGDTPPWDEISERSKKGNRISFAAVLAEHRRRLEEVVKGEPLWKTIYSHTIDHDNPRSAVEAQDAAADVLSRLDAAGWLSPDEAEKLRVENNELRGALGYEVPADTPVGRFQCGMCNAGDLLYSELKGQLRDANAEVERLKKQVADCQSGMWVSCIYCGHRYGPKATTPVTQADLLTKHAEQCSKHPMSTLRAEVERLEKQLADTQATAGRLQTDCDRLTGENARLETMRVERANELRDLLQKHKWKTEEAERWKCQVGELKKQLADAKAKAAKPDPTPAYTDEEIAEAWDNAIVESLLRRGVHTLGRWHELPEDRRLGRIDAIAHIRPMFAATAATHTVEELANLLARSFPFTPRSAAHTCFDALNLRTVSESEPQPDAAVVELTRKISEVKKAARRGVFSSKSTVAGQALIDICRILDCAPVLGTTDVPTGDAVESLLVEFARVTAQRDESRKEIERMTPDYKSYQKVREFVIGRAFDVTEEVPDEHA